ncbi:hypothetical protein CF335_g8420 [Tilletia laevis]|nr:hypothetical protein CF335_g8420 [Tilletia laevis]
MPSSPIILTLVPQEDPTSAQSISFLDTDWFRVHLGGTRIRDRYSSRASFHSVDFTFDEDSLTSNHAEISVQHGVVFITPLQDDKTVCVNDHPLTSKETIRIGHLDQVRLSLYEPYDDVVNSVIVLQVHLTSLPLPLLPNEHQALRYRFPHVSTTPTVLHALYKLSSSTLQLQAELASTKQQLQDALEAAAAHTCTPPAPPRSYGQLLNDLRQSDRPSPLEAASKLAPTSSSSSPSSSPLSPAPYPLPSISSSVQSECSPSSRPAPASTSAATSVLTSVLRSSSVPESLTSSVTSVPTSVLRPRSSSPPSSSLPEPIRTSPPLSEVSSTSDSQHVHRSEAGVARNSASTTGARSNLSFTRDHERRGHISSLSAVETNQNIASMELALDRVRTQLHGIAVIMVFAFFFLIVCVLFLSWSL